MILEEIMERYPDEEFITADGFDEAILGVSDGFSAPRIVYSVSRCLDILGENMDPIDAIEFFTYNISGAYVGEQTPVWCWDCF